MLPSQPEAEPGSSVTRSHVIRIKLQVGERGIDEDRAKAWTIVREVDNATDPEEGPGRASLAVAVIKAMND